jgi:hypothetical protein
MLGFMLVTRFFKTESFIPWGSYIGGKATGKTKELLIKKSGYSYLFRAESKDLSYYHGNLTTEETSVCFIILFKLHISFM